MDLRTFFKPRIRHAVAARLEAGDTAPPLPDIVFDRPTVVAFLRHVGCPFAEKTMRDLVAFAEREPEIQCVAVSHGTRDNTADWSAAIGKSDRVAVVDDPEAKYYAAWGLGLTPVSHWLGRKSLRGVMQLAREGIRNRHPSGTRWQSAGTFGIRSNGIIAWVHIPEHGADLPNFENSNEALQTE